MSASPIDAATYLHAVIAKLRAERDAGLAREATLVEELGLSTAELAKRTAQLATRNSEYGERIEYQAATLDVLRAMSASPGDPQPVFDLIVRRACDLCDAYGVTITEFDGTLVYLRATVGISDDPKIRASVLAQYPYPPERDTIHGRVILDRQIVRINDHEAEPGMRPYVRTVTAKSSVSIPLMRGDTVIGTLGMGSRERGGFSDSQIELLKTFAEQAAIAITSAETYRALQARTADIQESLEYQTATSDVLKVISRSTFDLQPVLAMVAETAARLCLADQAAIYRREGDKFHLAASIGFPPEFAANLNERGAFVLTVGSPGLISSTIAQRGAVHIHDVAAVPGYPDAAVRLGKQRTSLGVPLLREGEPVGVIVLARQRVEPFTDRQIELVSTFADQAVIAIENTRLITEQREALEQQTATAEVLGVINSNPGDLAPVFDAILEKAHGLCGITMGSLELYDGQRFRAVAVRGLSDAFADMLRQGYPASENPATGPLIDGGRLTHIRDLAATDYAITRSGAELDAGRTLLCVPLRRDGTLLGMIASGRKEVRPFSDQEIALLENFAAQAVIAMENARLLTEQREALEQQTATAEVLQVINASPGNLVPVFDAMLERAMRLCGAAFGLFHTYDDEWLHSVVQRGVPPLYAEYRAQNPVQIRPGSGIARAIEARRTHKVLDLMATEAYAAGEPAVRAMVELGGVRTLLSVPLCKDEAVLGLITVYRQEVRAFSDKQIALLENFAAQAVIAMENARLLEEVRQRQEELRITFENMGDGVAMFDGAQHLVAWNRKFQDMLDVPDEIIARHQTFSEYVRYLADRGEYGPEADRDEQVRRLIEQVGQSRTYERMRPDGRVIEVRHNPVADGGFVLIYADITERKQNEAEIRAARDAAEEASRTIETAYRDLKAAQANLIQAEKMASLGQLTAGIAHEIKNPLNFVNNFAELSVDLLGELKDAIAPAEAALNPDQRDGVDVVVTTLTSNLEKITEHGKRADGIVKAMLEHSRGSSAERRMVDLNALIDEALNLAYHGARAQDQSFNITLERDFGEAIAPIEVNPQDMTRVFLNIFSNGFYATTKRAKSGAEAGFVPTLKVSTRDSGEVVEIRVRDNGTGIPAEIRDKLFQPFFTTKPTGEGTGLGLSITYDIVTKQHGGAITVDSEVDAFTEFVVALPRQMFTNGGSRA